MTAKKCCNFKWMLFLLFAFLSVNVFAEPLKPIIQDNADLLSEEEEQLLYHVMEPITEFGGVAFVTNKDEYSGSADDLAYRYCLSFFDNQSGVVFLLDMYNRRIQLYSTGKIYDSMGRMWSDIIADKVYQHATDEEYFICAQKTFSMIITILNGGKVGAPMRYVSFILLSIAMTLLVMFIILYSSRKKAKFGEKFNLLTEPDKKELVIEVLERTKTKETRISHSSSSGGGRSGGGRSGGGRSGGGGGHGF